MRIELSAHKPFVRYILHNTGAITMLTAHAHNIRGIADNFQAMYTSGVFWWNQVYPEGKQALLSLTPEHL